MSRFKKAPTENASVRFLLLTAEGYSDDDTNLDIELVTLEKAAEALRAAMGGDRGESDDVVAAVRHWAATATPGAILAPGDEYDCVILCVAAAHELDVLTRKVTTTTVVEYGRKPGPPAAAAASRKGSRRSGSR